jgi:hypothetical protein
MKQKFFLLACVAAIAVLGSGCAITDYEGHASHQTSAEAKLFATEISFTGTGDADLDGTYSYTVKYDNRNGRDVNLTIYTYRNPVPSSFSRDGQIDRDGDDVQGRSGILGGKFLPQWTVTDPAPDCQFFANRIQSHGGAPPPAIALCEVVLEEIDKDLELQASFGNVGDLLGQIWSGALDGGFTAELTGVTLGGVEVPLSQALSVNAKANGIRPTQISIDLGSPGGQALVQALLNNTQDGVPTSLGLNFAGGMSINLPNHLKAVFNHGTLGTILQ